MVHVSPRGCIFSCKNYFFVLFLSAMFTRRHAHIIITTFALPWRLTFTVHGRPPCFVFISLHCRSICFSLGVLFFYLLWRPLNLQALTHVLCTGGATLCFSMAPASVYTYNVWQQGLSAAHERKGESFSCISFDFTLQGAAWPPPFFFK